MKCILANALWRALEYPNSAMLVHIAQRRREAQSDKLRVFLAECSTPIAQVSKSKLTKLNSSSASWINFLGGWLSTAANTDLVDGSSGIALPGYDYDGQWVPGDWHGTSNEPLKETVKAWVVFFEDYKLKERCPNPGGSRGRT